MDIQAGMLDSQVVGSQLAVDSHTVSILVGARHTVSILVGELRSVGRRAHATYKNKHGAPLKLN